MKKTLFWIILAMVFSLQKYGQMNISNDILLKSPIDRLEQDVDGKLLLLRKHTIENYDGVAVRNVTNERKDSLLHKENQLNAKLRSLVKNQNFTASEEWKVAHNSSHLKYALNSKNQLHILVKESIKKLNLPDTDNDFEINSIREEKPYLFISTQDQGLLIWDERSYHIHRIDVSSGLSSNNVQDAIIDAWGNLRIANGTRIKTVTEFVRSNHKSPFLNILGISINGKKHESKDQIILDQGEEFEVRFESVDLQNADGIINEYRLSSEANWKKTMDNLIRIKAENPGHFLINIRSSVDGEYYSYKNIPFKVKKPFWAPETILLVLGLSVLVGIWLLSLLYQHNKNKSYQRDRDRYLLENKLLRTEKKALQMQMNPHFMFNALNAIQGLITLEETDKAQRYLQAFSKMLRSMLHQSRKDTITLQEEVEYLTQYLQIEQLANNDKFTFNISCSEELEDDLRIPNMIVQPFAENAVKHAFKGRASGSIRISFRPLGNHVLCTVIDDGIGMDSSRRKNENHKSLGIEVVKERLANYHKNEKREFVKFLNTKGSEASGTRVELLLPILN